MSDSRTLSPSCLPSHSQACERSCEGSGSWRECEGRSQAGRDLSATTGRRLRAGQTTAPVDQQLNFSNLLLTYTYVWQLVRTKDLLWRSKFESRTNYEVGEGQPYLKAVYFVWRATIAVVGLSDLNISNRLLNCELENLAILCRSHTCYMYEVVKMLNES